MDEDPNKQPNPETPATDTPADDSALPPELMDIIEEISSDSSTSASATDVHAPATEAPTEPAIEPSTEPTAEAPTETIAETPIEPTTPSTAESAQAPLVPSIAPDAAEPVAQTPSPEPEPTPEPVVAPAPEPTTTPLDSVQKTKPKRSKIPLVVGLILAVLLIGLGAFWLIYRSAPKIQAIDAVSNLFSAKNLTIRGDVELDLAKASVSGLKSFKINFSGTSSHIPETSAVSFVLTDADDTVHKVDLEETVVSDGTIYFKTSGLKKALAEVNISGLYEAIVDNYGTTIDIIDDQWWMISVPDVISHLNQKYSANLDDSLADSYQCAIDFIAKNNGQGLAELYQKHQFANIEAYSGDAVKATEGGNLFSVTIDHATLNDYYKAIQNSDYQKRLVACFSSESNSSDSTDDESYNELPDYELPPIYIEVSNWEHRLLRLYVPEISTAETGLGFADLHFAYPANTSIDAPGDAKPVTILLDAMLENSVDQNYNIYDIPDIDSLNIDTTDDSESDTEDNLEGEEFDVYIEEDEDIDENATIESYYGDDDA